MGKCKNCGIVVLDDTEKCPFCRCILTRNEKQGHNMYPDAGIVAHRFRLFENLVLFLSILIEVILIYLNYILTPEFAWSAITGMAFFYINVVLRLAIAGKSGYMFKIISLIVIGVGILIGIDYLMGYVGWSLNFVVPSGIILLDLGILLLMIVNHRNWQSYMMFQILNILLSLIPTVLLIMGIVTFPYLTLLALALSIFVFLGTLILGDRRARTELKRRFHI